MTISGSERSGRSEPSLPRRRFAAVATIVGASLLTAGCGSATPTPPADGSPPPSTLPSMQVTEPSTPTPHATPTGEVSAAPQVAMPELPPDFPAPPGAERQPIDEAEPLIARWRLDDHGSVAYDFYLEALPAAGYPITLTAPGGGAAMIRFEAASGEIWQVEMYAPPGDAYRTIIQLGLERP